MLFIGLFILTTLCVAIMATVLVQIADESKKRTLLLKDIAESLKTLAARGQ